MIPIRLNKYLADQGVASRRGADALIEAGKIKVGGAVATLGTKVDPDSDKVEYRGQVLGNASGEKCYFLLYKPTGYITTTKDEAGRPTVLSLLPKKLQSKHLYPVGRLDLDTSGLLLLTNDGDLTYKLTHPKHVIAKVYEARVQGEPTTRELKRFSQGLQVAHRRTAPADIEIINTQNDHTLLRITLHEGRHRQVKRMCLAINHPVVALKRVEFAGLNLGTLATGTGRQLTPDEVANLQNL